MHELNKQYNSNMHELEQIEQHQKQKSLNGVNPQDFLFLHQEDDEFQRYKSIAIH